MRENAGAADSQLSDKHCPAGFDFTAHVRRACEDIAAKLPELAHLEMDRVAIRYCQTRRSGPDGLHASLTPLRFAGGATHITRRGRRWTVEPVLDTSGREMLYLLSFYLPRFLNLPFREKLLTVLHELWHVSPAFDGDLRRLPGRCFAHGHSEQQYHRQMEHLAERWLARVPPEACYAFLRYNFRQLKRRYGGVYGTRIATPKLVRSTRLHS
jgi:hypothetical protein